MMQYEAVYSRQSVDKKDSLSIEFQLEWSKKLCETSHIREYADRGYSGKNTKRPDFQRLMEDIKSGIIKRVIVYRLDRFSRSLLDFIKTWNVLSTHCVEFLSVNERFDTSTPMGKAVLMILIVFAELERETTAIRVKDNYYQRLTLGRWMGGPAPYGFDIGRIDEKIPTLETNDCIYVVERIFSEYLNPNVSLGAIAKFLNENDIVSPKGKTWTNISLARLIRNPVYVKTDPDVYRFFKNLGVEIENDISQFTGEFGGILVGKRGASTRIRTGLKHAHFSIGNWEGVIDSDIWMEAQQKLRTNEQIKRTGSGENTWLSGIIKCGHCGRALVHTQYKKTSGEVIRYFNCSGRREQQCTAEVSTIYADKVEMYVEEQLIQILKKCKEEGYVEEIKQTNFDAELVGIQEKISNLMQILSSGNASELTVKHINQEIEKLEEESSTIEQELYISRPSKIVFPRLKFNKLDFNEKKAVVKTFIEKILIADDTMEIVWKI